MICLVSTLLLLVPPQAGKQSPPTSSKEAMKRVQVLVGQWRITGETEGKEGFWSDTFDWNYKIEKIRYSLVLTAKEGHLLKEGKLGYSTRTKKYRLDAVRADGSKVAYEGALKDTELTLDEVVGKDAKTQERIVFTLLRGNRHLAAVDRRAVGTEGWTFAHAWQGTKEGVPFIKNQGILCVVTGGTGSSKVTHKGKTYYVCCIGCRKSFDESPDKFIAAAKKEGWIK